MLSSHSDYWPFGYPLHSRNSNLQRYRFGFQGQEKDPEWTGQQGSHLAFKYRIHDARIGRFLSIDPLTKDYPWNSPYAFSENKVINHVELEGLEAWSITRNWKESDETKFEVFVADRIIEMQENNVKNDCADLAVQLLSEYASKEGLDVSFTRTDGSKVYSSHKEYKDIGVEEFMNIAKGQTNAESIDNDMKPLDQSEEPKPGDMTNSGYHVNIVREANSKEKEQFHEDAVPTTSSSLPARKHKNSAVHKNSEFKEFKVIDEAVKKDTKEGIRLFNEAGGVQ